MQKILMTAALLAISSNIYASNKMYATIGGGWVVPSKNSSTVTDSGFAHYGPTASPSGESFFNLPAVKWENKYNNGFNLNAAIGYNLFRSIRADIEFLYQRFKRDISGTYGWAEYDALSAAIQDSISGVIMVPTSNHTNVYSILTNGYYDFHNTTRWTPLLGGGFGVAWIKSGSTTASGRFATPGNPGGTPTLQNSPSLSGTAFAWQFKAGVMYDYSQLLSIVVQYRLFGTTLFDSNTSSITTNPNASPTDRRIFRVAQQSLHGLITNAIELQLQFKFA